MKTITSIHSEYARLLMNSSLVLQEIREIASNPELQKKGEFVCTGIQLGHIFLGVDFIPSHVQKFKIILANTLLIDKFSREAADLSPILLRIMIDGTHVANLVEDVSENGRLTIFDNGISFGPYNDYLSNFFSQDSMRSVFVVYDPRELKAIKESGDRSRKLSIRMPIIDLDHFTMRLDAEAMYTQIPGDTLEEYTLKL